MSLGFGVRGRIRPLAGWNFFRLRPVPCTAGAMVYLVFDDRVWCAAAWTEAFRLRLGRLH